MTEHETDKTIRAVRNFLILSFMIILAYFAGKGLYTWGHVQGQLTEKVELEHYLKAQIYPSNINIAPVDTTDNLGDY